VFSLLTVKQPCVQLNVFQINDNPFDNIIKLLYASPFKGVSTSFNYHCCSTWPHPCWTHEGKFQVGVVDEQLMIMIISWSRDSKMCLFDTRFLSWWKVEIFTKKRISSLRHLNWRYIIFYDKFYNNGPSSLLQSRRKHSNRRSKIDLRAIYVWI
jgi:hypothetical protein